MKIINNQSMTFLKNLAKSYTEGVYSDTPINRKLGRVGMSYMAYRDKIKAKNPEKSEEQIIKNYGFKRGDIVTAILPNGKEIEAIFDKVQGRDNDSVSIKVGDSFYWTTPDKLKLKESKKKKLSSTQISAIEDKIYDLKWEAKELEQDRARIELDQEDEVGALSEEEKTDGNHPVVVKYADLLTDIDDKLAKIYQKIKIQEDKLK